jgi:hypothetical protein
MDLDKPGRRVSPSRGRVVSGGFQEGRNVMARKRMEEQEQENKLMREVFGQSPIVLAHLSSSRGTPNLSLVAAAL